MKLELKNLPQKLLPVRVFIKRYIVFIFLMIMLLLFGFIVFRVNQLSQKEPSEDAIAEKLQTVQRPRIDQEALEKIQNLEDQNLQVRSLIREARDNPFSE